MNWRNLPAAVAFVVVALIIAFGTQVHASTALFHDVPAPAGVGVNRAMAADTVARDTRYVQLDLSALGDTRTTLNLFPGKIGGVLTAVWDRAEETSPDTWAWIGTLDGIDDSEVTIVLNTAKGIAVGSVVMPGAVYRIRYGGQGVHVVEDLDTTRFPDDIVRKKKVDAADVAAAADAAAADAPVTLDVLVLYTQAARAAAGGTTAMQNLIDLAVTETNQGYANSGVYHRIRAVHKAEFTYNENTADPFGDALDTITANGTVANLRTTKGADLVALIIEHTNLCGLAWLFNGAASTGFSVTARTCATGYYSFGHEIGHNLNAQHDWQAPDHTGFAANSSNHGYLAPDDSWRTIMGYATGCAAGTACTRINRWSNPDLKHNGVVTGRRPGLTNAADNRLALNNAAPTVANYKTSTGCTSQPTISPTSRSATAGGGTASITVTGLAACTWGATSTVSWITVTAGATGSGNGTVNYRVAANTGNARTGTLKIAGRTFTVSQAAGTACGTSSNPCPLSSGVAKTGLNGASNSMKYYKISVPSGSTKLVVQTSGGSGNVDVYVRRTSVPTTSTYTCRNTGAGTAETCTINNPASGTWYIMLHGPGASYSNVTLKATVTAGCSPNTSPGCALTDNVSKTVPSTTTMGQKRYYYIDVPAGRTQLAVTLSGGTGDADLYVRFNAVPTTSAYNCYSYYGGNIDSCVFTSPAAGRWYIMVDTYAAHSGVSVNANY